DDLLDLPRVDVVAAADDQFLLPVHYVVEAVLVDPCKVPGAEPAAADGRRGRLRALPVALHDVVPADRDLADLTGRRRGVAVAFGDAEEAQFHSLDRQADRARLALVGPVEGGDRGGLR